MDFEQTAALGQKPSGEGPPEVRVRANRRKGRRRFNLPVFFWFLLSYAAVVVLPLGLTVFGGLVLYSKLQTRAMEYAENLAERSRRVLDERVLRANQLVQALSLNNNIQRILYYADPRSAEGIYEMKEAIRTIQGSSAVVPDVDSIFLYSHKHHIILTHQGKYEPGVFYDSAIASLGVPYAEWAGLVTSYRNLSWIGDSHFTVLRGGKGFLGLFSSLPYGVSEQSSVVGTLGVLFSTHLFEGGLKDILDVPGTRFYISDGEKILYDTVPGNADGKAGGKGGLAPAGGAGLQSIQDRAPGKIRVSLRSNAMPWTYTAEFQDRAILGDLRNLALTMVLSVLIVTVAGSAISFIFARANSRRVREVLALFGRRDDFPAIRNEFELAILRAGEAVEEIGQMERTLGSFERISYPIEDEEKLLNALRAGSEEDALAILDRLRDANPACAAGDPETARCLYLDVVSTLSKTRREGGPYAVMRSLFETDDPAIMHALVRGTVSSICAMAVPPASNRATMVRSAVDACIAQRFSDRNLTMDGIASATGLSAAYMASLYKSSCGKTVADALLRKRVCAAKDDLKDPSLPIKEIAYKTGFSSDAVFIRVFKRFEGVTPGQFRDSLSQDSLPR